MKRCKKCFFENPDSNSICEKCYAPLNTADDGSKELEMFFEKQEQKEKRAKAFHLALIPVYIVICTVLLILTLINSDYGADIAVFYVVALVLCALYYFSIFHTDALFKIEHITVIANIDEAKPSDWYYITSRIGAYAGLVFGIVLVAIPFINSL